MTGISEIFVGGGERQHKLLTRYANRHGLVTGATVGRQIGSRLVRGIPGSLFK